MLIIKSVKKNLTTLILAFSFIVCPPVIAEPLDRIIAIVNDEAILQSSFTDNYDRAVQRIQQQGAKLPTTQALRSQVMEQMISRTIILKMAIERGMKVTDRQLNATVTKIAENNGISLKKFREVLNAQGQDYIATRENIREDILIRQVQESSINQRIQVSDREIKNFLRSQIGKNNAEVLISEILITIHSPMTPSNIKKAQTIANNVHQELVSGAVFSNIAISRSDAANALNGGDMGWRKTAELPSSLVDSIAQLTPEQFSEPTRTPTGFQIILLRQSRNGQQAVTVNKTNVRHILISSSEVMSKSQAKRVASQLYQKLINNPQDFAVLAEENSNDPGSSSQGGELGWTESGQMVPEFEQIMNSTNKGQISLPFESRFGWHILQVLDRKSENVTNIAFENQARNLIGKRKFNEAKGNWLREIRTNAYVEFK